MSEPSRSPRDWRELWLQPVATVLSVLIAGFSIYFSVRANNQNEQDRARSAFALAAAQVVMNQPSCELAQARARTLITLFPQQLESTLEPLTRPTLSSALCKQLRSGPSSNASPS